MTSLIQEQEARAAYDDYVSSCAEKHTTPLSFEAWVRYAQSVPTLPPTDPQDNLPY